MSRNTLSESAIVIATSEVGQFANGDTVTIELYKNGTAEPIDSAVCIQLGTSGIFLWMFSNLTTAPSAYAKYNWIMSDTTTKKASGAQEFGGWPDLVTNLQGVNTVTITIKDKQAIPVVMEGVKVDIYNSDNTLFLDSKTTDLNGLAVFLLDDASYKVRLSRSQTGFTVPEDLVVSGATAQEYTGIPSVITPPVGANDCIVSVFASAQNPSLKLTTLKGTATIISLPTLLEGEYFPNTKMEGTYDSSSGRIYWTLPRLAVVQFKIDTLGISESKTIPDQPAANYQDF